MFLRTSKGGGVSRGTLGPGVMLPISSIHNPNRVSESFCTRGDNKRCFVKILLLRAKSLIQQYPRLSASLLAMLIFIVLFVYYQLLVGHGTVSPPAVWMTTRSLQGPKLDPYPPEDWKPPFRVVVSLATMPHRVPFLDYTIASIRQQSLQPATVYVNMPKHGISRTGAQFPDWKAPEGVQVLRPEVDVGPLTKLLPALEAENDDSTLIITLDDDKVYDNDHLRLLAWYAHQRPDVAWSFCGWSFLEIPGPTRIISVYVPVWMRAASGQAVEILQGVCGNALRRGFFGDLVKLRDPPKGCFTTDDIWISANLAHNKIPRALIPLAKSHTNPPWRADHEKSELSLSYFNGNNYGDRRCIEAVEERFGSAWPKLTD